MVYHAFTSIKSDGGDSTLVRPSNWNAAHLQQVVATAGENLAAFDSVYVNSDGKMYRAKANSISTMPVLFMAAAAISSGNTGSFYTPGQVITNGLWAWALAAGESALLYVSDSVFGGLTATIPTVSGDQVQIVGTVLSATSILFSAIPVVAGL